jgi:hypothetical protein
MAGKRYGGSFMMNGGMSANVMAAVIVTLAILFLGGIAFTFSGSVQL